MEQAARRRRPCPLAPAPGGRAWLGRLGTDQLGRGPRHRGRCPPRHHRVLRAGGHFARRQPGGRHRYGCRPVLRLTRRYHHGPQRLDQRLRRRPADHPRQAQPVVPPEGHVQLRHNAHLAHESRLHPDPGVPLHPRGSLQRGPSGADLTRRVSEPQPCGPPRARAVGQRPGPRSRHRPGDHRGGPCRRGLRAHPDRPFPAGAHRHRTLPEGERPSGRGERGAVLPPHRRRGDRSRPRRPPPWARSGPRRLGGGHPGRLVDRGGAPPLRALADPFAGIHARGGCRDRGRTDHHGPRAGPHGRVGSHDDLHRWLGVEDLPRRSVPAQHPVGPRPDRQLGSPGKWYGLVERHPR